jgi:uncharacterized protein YndB with AHSA1/START domain
LRGAHGLPKVHDHNSEAGDLIVRSMPALTTLICGLLVAAAAVPAQAEVTSSSPSGFIVKIDLRIAARPDAVYDRFLQIGSWWSDAHTYSGKAANMTLEPRPGGCFCEALPDGKVFRHMDVSATKPGKSLRLSGGLGPLHNLGANGLMAVQLTPDGTSTRLQMTYTVSGSSKDLPSMADPVDGVLREQFSRLKKFAETGNPNS